MLRHANATKSSHLLRPGDRMVICDASGNTIENIVIVAIEGSTKVTYRGSRWYDWFGYTYERIALWFEDRFPEWVSVW